MILFYYVYLFLICCPNIGDGFLYILAFRRVSNGSFLSFYFLVWFETKNIFWTKNRKCIKRNEEIPKIRLKFQTKRGFHWKKILCYSKNRAVWIIVYKKCYIFVLLKTKNHLFCVIYHIIFQILLCITHKFHQFLCYISHK